MWEWGPVLSISSHCTQVTGMLCRQDPCMWDAKSRWWSWALGHLPSSSLRVPVSAFGKWNSSRASEAQGPGRELGQKPRARGLAGDSTGRLHGFLSLSPSIAVRAPRRPVPAALTTEGAPGICSSDFLHLEPTGHPFMTHHLCCTLSTPQTFPSSLK